MKRFFTLLIGLIAMVGTVGATDYYIGANTNLSEGDTKWEIKGQMLDTDGDGTYSLIIQVPTHQVYNSTTYYYDFYFTIFTSATIANDWSNAYRPTSDNVIKGNDGCDEVTMSENASENEKTIQYPIDWNDYEGNLVKNYASALKIDYTPSTHKLKVTRLIAVASANNSYSTTTDYLTETSNGSKIYKGRVALDNYKIVCNQNGYLYWGRQKVEGDSGYGDGYMTNATGDDVSTTPGIYDVTADLSTFMWQDPVHVTAPASLGAYGMATMCSEYALDFTGISNVKAYTITGVTEGNLAKSQVTGKVKAGTGLFLEGETGASADVPTTIYTDDPGTNLLKGVTKDTHVDQKDGSNTNYILTINAASGNVDTPKFFKVNGTSGNTILANKAYLQIPTASARESFWFAEGEETTAINSLSSSSAALNTTAPAYNLAGQRVANSYKGIVIQNGKKYITK